MVLLWLETVSLLQAAGKEEEESNEEKGGGQSTRARARRARHARRLSEEAACPFPKKCVRMMIGRPV